MNKEIVIVNDCSTDGTREWLKASFPDGSRSGSRLELDDTGNITLADALGASRVTIRPFIMNAIKAREARCEQGSGQYRGT